MSALRGCVMMALVVILSAGLASAQVGEPVGGPGTGDPVGDPGEGEPVGDPGEGDPVDDPGEGDPVGDPGEGDPVGDPGDGEPVGGFGEGDPVGGPVAEPVPAPIAKAPLTMVHAARITITGAALAGGEIALAVETSTGQRRESRIGIVAGMRGDEVAPMLARDLRAALAQHLEIREVGNEVWIRRLDHGPEMTFTVRVVDWSVFHLGFVVLQD